MCAATLITAPGCADPAGTHPATTATRPATAGDLPRPIPAVTLRALTERTPARVTPVTATQAAQAGVNLEQSGGKVLRAVRAREPHGSQILGMTLARVTGIGPFIQKPQLAWLVSIDPYGGAYRVNGPACGTDNFVIGFADPVSGKWLMESAGRATGLRPRPALGPKPSLARGGQCAGPAGGGVDPRASRPAPTMP